MIRALLLTGFVRAAVVSQSSGQISEDRADTGVIQSVVSTSLTLVDSDGTTVDIPIGSTTLVQINSRTADATALAAGMRSTVIQYGDGSPTQIWAVGRPLARTRPGGGG